MKDVKTQSLAELEKLYRQHLQEWTQKRAGYLKQAHECEQQMREYDEKLRHIKALADGPEAGAAPAPRWRRPTAGAPQKRRRRSPLRDATLQVLRSRPGQKLTAKQIRTLIRKDTNKRCSRQTVNNNVNVLEEAGLVMRERAPKGTGSQFVFYAV